MKRPPADRPTAPPPGPGHRPSPSRQAPVVGVLTGELIGCDEAGRWLVDFPGNPSGQVRPALTTVPLCAREIGRGVVLAFESGDATRPVILGILQTPAPPPPVAVVDVEVDGQNVTVAARQQLVLRCGKASITLTRAGKILLRGTYLLSRSSGVNSIKGGSIQIN